MYSPHAWGWTGEHARIHLSEDVFPTRVGMDRGSNLVPFAIHRIPHTRGDGPLYRSRESGLYLYSPHAWGWTVTAPISPAWISVFPTRVGMDHFDSAMICFADAYSPHAWGWTATRISHSWHVSVFPTRVGMDRVFPPRRTRIVSIPHTRGDGPAAGTGVIGCVLYSPHAWGWTVFPETVGVDELVFPTRVGMDPWEEVWSQATPSIPHTRGDGPIAEEYENGVSKYSPHAWGWTVLSLRHLIFRQVFPTRVGMDRHGRSIFQRRHSIPHTRGDGPDKLSKGEEEDMYSPHAWGWTAEPGRKD